MQRKRKAFTLIELLVVIAIIALLIAITIPVLQTTRGNAKTIVCGSNVRQLQLALRMYEMQNGTFPSAFDTNGARGVPPGGYSGNSDMLGWWWFDLMADLFEKKFKRSILWCPARHIRDKTLKPNLLLGNYGVNQAICKGAGGGNDPNVKGIPLRINQIPRPSQTFVLGDSGYSTILWRYAEEPSSITGTNYYDSAYVPGLWPKSRGENHRSGTESDALNGRHPKKTVNTGFVDGHVARLKADDFLVEKVGGEYKNRSPLWLPKP
ncbi:MAG: prepilin-type N-terminal cleavage/methylation domain-containing protein [Sedimentisphaerales bacterium]|nr:prepilin-type N-terminal cleavage/methylation domain-containing protein [Sedimentisphaerales bacterium]